MKRLVRLSGVFFILFLVKEFIMFTKKLDLTTIPKETLFTEKTKYYYVISDLINSHKNKKNHTGVIIKVLNEPVHFISAKTIETGTVTVVYDRQNLDSIFGLSFFKFLYGEDVQAIDYHDCFTKNKNIRESEMTVVVGVEINKKDLLLLNRLTKATLIYGYKGSFDYLYDVKQQSEFNNVVLYRSDDDFYIGGKNIAQLENTVAMMLKISYDATHDWRAWPQSKYAIPVAHYSSFFPNIEEYGLSKTIFKDEPIEDIAGRTFKRSVVDNSRECLMWDFRNILESSLICGGSNIFEGLPSVKPSEYLVYKDRLETHINNSRREFVLRDKSFLDGKCYSAHFIPAVGFAIHDIFTISSKNVNTTVCVEEFSHHYIYHVYSTIKGRASLIASLIDGEKTWMQGNVICVHKMKENTGSYK